MKLAKIKFKPNYFIIPLITILVAALGGFFTKTGMQWYEQELIRPEITPPKWAFPVAWNLIFFLTTIAALITWNKGKEKPYFWLAIFLFVANALLNIVWTALFFGSRLIGLALIEMVILEITLMFLMVITYKFSKIIPWLLVPYLLWVGFATYLTYLIFKLN